MRAKSNKERDASDINIMIKNKNKIFPVPNIKEKANKSLIENNNRISDSTGTKEKPNIINSSSAENKINKSKKKIILIISLSSLALLLIIGIILIIAHFRYDYFKNKKELIVIVDRKVNYVSRYLENKNATNYYEFEGLNETQEIQNYSIINDFIVALNRKERIDKRYDFSDIDYLYEAFLLIINITQLNGNESFFLGGIDIYDESKTMKKLIEINNEIFSNVSNSSKNIFNIPFSKFYFYENGTLGQIYFPLGVNEFYKCAMMDLIEKVTPKLLKSLYKQEENKRRLENGKEGIYYNYEEIARNGVLNKTIIYEEKLQKNFGGNQDGYEFKDNQLNLKIVRIFNSSGEMNLLQTEGEALFVSRPPESKKDKHLRLNEEDNEIEKLVNTNESYYNLGFNEFKMNVNSNMELISNVLSPNITQKLNILSQMINLEMFEVSNGTTGTKEDKTSSSKEINNTDDCLDTVNYEKNKNNSGNANEKRNLGSDEINYPHSYKLSRILFGITFLGANFDYRHELEIDHNNGLRKNSLILRKGYEDSILSRVSTYQYYDTGSKNVNENAYTEKAIIDLGFNIFGFGPRIIVYLKSSLYNSISIDVINNEMKTKGYTSHEFTLGVDLKINFFVVSSGSKISRQFIKGTSYIQVKSISNSDQSEVIFYKNFNIFSVDLEIYFSIWLIFWEKKYSKTFNLFSGYPIYRNEIYYY